MLSAENHIRAPSFPIGRLSDSTTYNANFLPDTKTKNLLIEEEVPSHISTTQVSSRNGDSKCTVSINGMRTKRPFKIKHDSETTKEWDKKEIVEDTKRNGLIANTARDPRKPGSPRATYTSGRKVNHHRHISNSMCKEWLFNVPSVCAINSPATTRNIASEQLCIKKQGTPDSSVFREDNVVMIQGFLPDVEYHKNETTKFCGIKRKNHVKVPSFSSAELRISSSIFPSIITSRHATTKSNVISNLKETGVIVDGSLASSETHNNTPNATKEARKMKLSLEHSPSPRIPYSENGTYFNSVVIGDDPFDGTTAQKGSSSARNGSPASTSSLKKDVYITRPPSKVRGSRKKLSSVGENGGSSPFVIPTNPKKVTVEAQRILNSLTPRSCADSESPFANDKSVNNSIAHTNKEDEMWFLEALTARCIDSLASEVPYDPQHLPPKGAMPALHATYLHHSQVLDSERHHHVFSVTDTSGVTNHQTSNSQGSFLPITTEVICRSSSNESSATKSTPRISFCIIPLPPIIEPILCRAIQDRILDSHTGCLIRDRTAVDADSSTKGDNRSNGDNTASPRIRPRSLISFNSLSSGHPSHVLGDSGSPPPHHPMQPPSPNKLKKSESPTRTPPDLTPKSSRRHYINFVDVNFLQEPNQSEIPDTDGDVSHISEFAEGMNSQVPSESVFVSTAEQEANAKATNSLVLASLDGANLQTRIDLRRWYETLHPVDYVTLCSWDLPPSLLRCSPNRSSRGASRDCIYRFK